MRQPRCLLLFLLLVAGAASADETRRFYGYAFDAAGKRYLYTEVHEQLFAEGSWMGGSTRYLDPKGREFASKTMDFSQDRFVPAYRLEIPAQGYVEGINPGAEAFVMVRREGGDEETEAVERKGRLVADAGMPRLLLANFEKLMDGGEVAFRVIAPGRLATYKFRARRIEDAAAEGRPAVRFQVDMDSMLSLFAGPLRFTFDAETRQLREYSGTTNLRDPDGELYVVRVSYTDTPPAGAPELPPLQ